MGGLRSHRCGSLVGRGKDREQVFACMHRANGGEFGSEVVVRGCCGVIAASICARGLHRVVDGLIYPAHLVRRLHLG